MGRQVGRWEDRKVGLKADHLGDRWEDRTEVPKVDQQAAQREDLTGGLKVGQQADRSEALTAESRGGQLGAQREDPPPVGWAVKGSTGPTAGQPKVQVRPQVRVLERVARPSRAPATGPMQEALQRPVGWAVKMEARGRGRATGQQPVRGQPLMQVRKRVPCSSTAVFEACPRRPWSQRRRAAPWWHRPQRFRRRKTS